MTSDARLERKESSQVEARLLDSLNAPPALGALQQGSAPAVSSDALPSAPSQERGTSEAPVKKAHFKLDGELCPTCQGEKNF